MFSAYGGEIMMKGLYEFIVESNAIEGILRKPTKLELSASEFFLGQPTLFATKLGDLQNVFAPNKPIREFVGMDVYVGDYTPPLGGSNIVPKLNTILRRAQDPKESPWKVHVVFELLHPYLDGNGRTGCMLWAWQMNFQCRRPFSMSFLQRFYYQTLEAKGK
jgi:hypothetical protein